MNKETFRRWVISLCHWPYVHTGRNENRVKNIDELCNLAVRHNAAIELPPFSDIKRIRQRGIGIPVHLPQFANNTPAYRIGLCNDPEQVREFVLPTYINAMKAAAPGEKMIVFTGVVKEHRPANQDAEQCIRYLTHLANQADNYGVTLVLEHLNDKGAGPDSMEGHAGYRGSDLDWVAKVIRAVNSPHVRLLFDAYHVSRMHGADNVTTLLEKHFDIIGHVHVAGDNGKSGGVSETMALPGGNRVELYSRDQQIDFCVFGDTLTELGYDGAVGLEYILDPTQDVNDGIARSIECLVG